MPDNEEGKAPHPMKGKTAHRIPEERYVAARILYETTPGATFKSIAAETGISWRGLEERSKKDGGWAKRSLLPPSGMNEAAQQVADRYTGKLADYGDDITAEHKQAAVVETAAEVAIDMRAQLLDRHRKEWSAIRQLVYRNLKAGAFNDQCKLAKISAETLQIVQSNERKAYGLDKGGDGDTSVTVVIDRGDA